MGFGCPGMEFACGSFSLKLGPSACDVWLIQKPDASQISPQWCCIPVVAHGQLVHKKRYSANQAKLIWDLKFSSEHRMEASSSGQDDMHKITTN